MSLNSKDPEYIEALEATTRYGEPPVGFVVANSDPIPAQLQKLIKQNNTALELIIRLIQKVNKLEEEIQHIKVGKESKEEIDLKQAIEDLSQKVKAIKIEEKAPPSRINRVYFYEDPAAKLKKVVESSRK